MPCEGCNVQFTVFRRKRVCTDCRRFYCANCLTSKCRKSSNIVLCERCEIFAKRPLLKVDLLQLKPKDLIFYLQSKHISTTGCVEKDELVGLVLNHVNESDSLNTNPVSCDTRSSNGTRSEENTNSFDNIKQTCQNFFNNITERVDLNFDTKTTSQAQNHRSSSDSTTSHIADQPRVSTREIPTYSSFQNRQRQPESPNCNSGFTFDGTTTSNGLPKSTSSPTATACNSRSSSQISSPVVSIDSISSRGTSSNSLSQRNGTARNGANCTRNNREQTNQDISGCQANMATKKCLSNICIVDEANNITGSLSDCECSDDEIITNFKARRASLTQKSDKVLPQNYQTGQLSATTTTASPTSSSSIDIQIANVSGCSASTSGMVTGNTVTSCATNKTSPSLKIESYDESSESSFEELGAIGGESEDSRIAVEICNQTKNWQFVDKPAKESSVNASTDDQISKQEIGPLTVALVAANQQQQQFFPYSARAKRVKRRRSDGYLNRRRQCEDDLLPSSSVFVSNRDSSLDEREEQTTNNGDTEGDHVDNDNIDYNQLSSLKKLSNWNYRNCCKRCGKSKINIKRHVSKLRRQLENSQISEANIKQELEEFLVYLECRTKSLDCSDSEPAENNFSRYIDSQQQQLPASPQFYDNNDGIHVYAASDEDTKTIISGSRFINLESFMSLGELENLSVKQLKEILMLNRVDYKGCCEKQELLDRVVRLWKNLKGSPAVEKLQVDELCKICMDAPIECVILECGHMATCTGCGKVLSECPICRQYIVRVVRFFRA